MLEPTQTSFKCLPQPYPFWILPSNRQWEKILHLGERREYAVHDVVLASNSVTPCFFYLQSGKVRCEQLGLNGNIKLCYSVTSGSIFGENVAISATPSYAKFLVTAHSIVYAFSLETLYKTIIIQYPDLVINIMELMAYKVRMYSLHLYSTTLNDIGSQICRILYQLLASENFATECVPPFTQQDIADVLGVHRNTVVRSIKELKAENIVSHYTKKSLKVESIERLLHRSMNPKH